MGYKPLYQDIQSVPKNVYLMFYTFDTFFSTLLQKTSHSFQYPLEGCEKQENE